MFEQAVLLGETEKSILLSTSKGRPIKNLIEVDPPPTHSVQRYATLVRLCGGNWQERKPATGRYNCAGHVWASRRTSILEIGEFQAIIQDDGYRDLRDGENPIPGDIAVYVDLDKDEEILHVGRVFALRQGITPESRPIARVISKWNSTSGESLHDAHDVPYARNFRFRLKYITDRP